MKQLGITTFLLSTILASGLSAAPITVRFDPSSSTVLPGDTFTVSLMADIPLTDPVLGWGLDVGFDTGILSLDSVAIGPLWAPGASFDSDGLAGLAFPFPVSGAGILLADLNFSALALGTTSLIASITPLDLTEGFPLAPPAPAGSFGAVNFQPGAVAVVPEPTSLVLLGIGLASVGGSLWRRRERRSRS